MDQQLKFYLQWTWVNWITVLLMVAVGWLVIGAVLSGVRQVRGANVSDD